MAGDVPGNGDGALPGDRGHASILSRLVTARMRCIASAQCRCAAPPSACTPPQEPPENAVLLTLHEHGIHDGMLRLLSRTRQGQPLALPRSRPSSPLRCLAIAVPARLAL